MMPMLHALEILCRTYGVGLGHFFCEPQQRSIAITRRTHVMEGREKLVAKPIPLHVPTPTANNYPRSWRFPQVQPPSSVNAAVLANSPPTCSKARSAPTSLVLMKRFKQVIAWWCGLISPLCGQPTQIRGAEFSALPPSDRQDEDERILAVDDPRALPHRPIRAGRWPQMIANHRLTRAKVW